MYFLTRYMTKRKVWGQFSAFKHPSMLAFGMWEKPPVVTESTWMDGCELVGAKL